MGQIKDKGNIFSNQLVSTLPLLVIASLLIMLAFVGARYYQSLMATHYDNINTATESSLAHSSLPGVTAGASAQAAQEIPAHNPPRTQGRSAQPNQSGTADNMASQASAGVTTEDPTPAQDNPKPSPGPPNPPEEPQGGVIGAICGLTRFCL